MEKEFVPYELAVKLKELGFNERCFKIYSDYDCKLYVSDRINHNAITNAPLWQQAFDWFREKGWQNVVVENSIGFHYSISKGWFSFMINSKAYNTYEQAREACLEKLIELVSSK